MIIITVTIKLLLPIYPSFDKKYEYNSCLCREIHVYCVMGSVPCSIHLQDDIEITCTYVYICMYDSIYTENPFPQKVKPCSLLFPIPSLFPRNAIHHPFVACLRNTQTQIHQSVIQQIYQSINQSTNVISCIAIQNFSPIPHSFILCNNPITNFKTSFAPFSEHKFFTP